jgi:hypothetical protein
VAAKTDWIVVKSICDWGFNKNNANKDVWQKTAAKNAAWVTLAALETSHIFAVTEGLTDHLISTSASHKGLIRSKWPSHFPDQLIRECETLHIVEEQQCAVVEVMSHAAFPSMMSLNGFLAENHIWTQPNAKKMRSAYWPKRDRVPLVVRLDMLLIRRNNSKHDGELLTYPSKWGTHMIHFRPWKSGQDPANRNKMNQVKFAAKFALVPESIQIENTGRFTVSLKINEEYGDLWLYIFDFLSVRFTSWSEQLHQVHQYGYTLDTTLEERNRWRHLREMRNDPVATRVNGDVLRSLHHFFDVNLTSLPNSFPD